MKQNVLSTFAESFNKTHPNFSYEKLVSTVLPFFESIDTGVSLACYLQLKHDPSGYVKKVINPDDYLDASSFRKDYACTKLLSKADFLPIDVNRKKVAEESFIAAEKVCLEVNRRILDRVTVRSSVVSNITFIAMRKIRSILGSCPELLDIPIRFGPGNNVDLRKNTSIFDKLEAVPTVTSKLHGVMPSLFELSPSWATSKIDGEIPSTASFSLLNGMKVVAGSKLGFVPKNAKTERAICTEPLINSVFQNGLGDIIARKLLRHGCDLRDQSHNQRLALKASRQGNLATVDLSAASDTISQAVVFDLLPLDWSSMLDTVRCHHYTYEGNTYEFHKFSSMGNGFTFALESLIFLALARAVCEHLGISTSDVSVYGDDIIIPNEAYDLLVEVFTHYGFTVNNEKSFNSGPFRESCGKDFFLGISVRPLFIKTSFSSESILSMANFLYQEEYYLQPEWKALRNSLLKWIPNNVRKVLVGPPGKGDGHIHVNYNSRYIKTGHHSKRKRGWEGTPYYTVRSIPMSRRVSSHFVYSSALYTVQFSPERMCGPPSAWVFPEKGRHGFRGCYHAVSRKCVRYSLTRAYHPWYN